MEIDDISFINTSWPIVVIDTQSLSIIRFNHSFQKFINLPETDLQGFYFPDFLNNIPFKNGKLAEHLLYSDEHQLFKISNEYSSEYCYVHLNALKVHAEEKDGILLMIDPAYPPFLSGEFINTPKTTDNYINEYYSQLFFLLTPEGQYIDWNKELEIVTDYSSDEISTMHPIDFFREDLHTVITNKMAEVFENGKAELQAPLLTKDKKEIDYHFFAKRVDIDQKPHFIGLATDVSHKDKVLTDQFFREKFYKKLIDNTDAIVYVKDEKGRYQFINLAFKKLFGLSDEEILGLSDDEIIFENQLNPIRRADLDVIRNKIPIQQEEKITINGKTRYFLTQKTPILAPNGTDYWLCGISTEITKRKETELSLKKLLDERDVLLQEVHHRVNNNLEIINALIYLQIHEVDHKDVKNELRYCKSRIQSIAAVHHLLYESENFSSIDLKKMVLRLTNQVLENFVSENQLQIDTMIEQIELNVNQAIPCVLIINEFLTNLFIDIDDIDSKLAHETININIFKKNDFINAEFRLKNIKNSRKWSKTKDKKPISNIFNIFLKQLKGQFKMYNNGSHNYFLVRFKKRDIRGAASHFLRDTV